MPERLIIVGGDAAGMSAASQARRRRKPDDLEIIAFERSPFVSYSACGEPYYVGGIIPRIDQLQARTPDQFRAMDIAVHIHHDVIAIDTQARHVVVRDVEAKREQTYGFDHLVYATGAAPFLPPLVGLDLKGVHVMRTLDDARAVRHFITDGVQKAVVWNWPHDMRSSALLVTRISPFVARCKVWQSHTNRTSFCHVIRAHSDLRRYQLAQVGLHSFQTSRSAPQA